MYIFTVVLFSLISYLSLVALSKQLNIMELTLPRLAPPSNPNATLATAATQRQLICCGSCSELRCWIILTGTKSLNLLSIRVRHTSCLLQTSPPGPVWVPSALSCTVFTELCWLDIQLRSQCFARIACLMQNVSLKICHFPQVVCVLLYLSNDRRVNFVPARPRYYSCPHCRLPVKFVEKDS